MRENRWKKLWEKDKKHVTSIFSYFHTMFSTLAEDKFNNFSKIRFVYNKCFDVYKYWNFVLGEGRRVSQWLRCALARKNSLYRIIILSLDINYYAWFTEIVIKNKNISLSNVPCLKLLWQKVSDSIVHWKCHKSSRSLMNWWWFLDESQKVDH